MTIVRVFYDPQTLRVLGVEHRADEPILGAAAYTAANRPPDHRVSAWFTTDLANRLDPDGDKIPIEMSTVDTSRMETDGQLYIQTDPEWPAEKQRRKDRCRGAGGRRDELLGKLRDDTITRSEERELMRLERGL